jgi:carbamoyl-phosphate synthase large subunit
VNVLVTSASRKVSLVRAFQEALARTGGGKVLAVDESRLSAALLAADERALVPRSDSSEFLPAIRRLCQKHGIGLLVPTRDEELPLFAAEKESFGAANVVVLVCSPASVALCQDKRAFVDFCALRKLPVPRTFAPGHRPALSDYPVFVKPRRGKGGGGCTRVDSPEELDRVLGRDPDGLVQENVSAPEFTLDLFADLAGRVLSVVPRERVRVFGGESFVSRTTKNPALIELGQRVAEAFELVGHNTIQCFWRPSSAALIEVNPRYGGAANLGFAAGAHTPELAIRAALGQTLSPRIGEFTDDLVMLRYTEDRFVSGAVLAALETQAP